ncbi:hypothetical protein FACS189450_13190 [Spirochaetia bacterium]|nr:hypothetical protein FACS189450_13190 [Spirochaetia bacterium]
MKARMLHTGLAVLTAFAILLNLGCQSPLEGFIGDSEVLAIPGPGNVKAIPYSGAILVSWDAVKDASSYDVYRKDVATGLVARVRNGGAETYYADIISLSNPLVDTAKYQYTVVSVAPGSTSAVIWNGQSSSAAVAAIVPATTPVVGATNVETAIDSGYIVIRWDSGATNTAPNFTKYYVRTITDDGTETIVDTRNVNETNSGLGAYFSTVRAASVPATGGVTKVYVDAKWIDALYPVAPLTVPAITYGGITLPRVVAVSAVRDAVTPTKVNVTWPVVSGATGYDVYRADAVGTAQASAWVKLSSPTDPSYIDLTVDANQDYVYGVVAKNETARSSSVAQGTVTAIPFNAPAAIYAARDDFENTKVQVTWGFVIGATSYELFRAEYNSTGTTQLTNYESIATPTTTDYIDSSVPIGKYYRYRVVAKKGALISENRDMPSNLPTATISAPASVTALRAPGASTTINVTWPIVINALAYDVYRAEYDGSAQQTDYTKVGSDVTALFFDDDTVDEDKGYRYGVVAKNGDVRSLREYSSITAGLTVGSISSVTVTRGSWTSSAPAEANDVLLMWNAVTGASSYRVWRAEFTGYNSSFSDGNSVSFADYLVNLGTWEEVLDPQTTTGSGYYYLTDTTLPSNSQNFVYKFQALNGAIVSAEPTYGYFLRAVNPSLTISSTALAATYIRSAPNTANGVTFSWSDTPTPSTWVFEYAEVEGGSLNDGDTNLSGATVKGSWSTPTGTPVLSSGTYTAIVTDLDLDKAYAFRIVAKNTGLQSGYAYRYVGKYNVPGGTPISVLSTDAVSDTGVVTRDIQFEKRLNVDSYDVVFTDIRDATGVTVPSGTAKSPAVNRLTPANPAYEQWRFTNLQVRYTYEYIITENVHGAISPVYTGYLNNSEPSGNFGTQPILASTAPTLIRTASGGVDTPIGVTGAYQIAVRVNIGPTTHYNDLSFDVYRVQKESDGRPYSGINVWDKLNTTPVPYATNLGYTNATSPAYPANGVYSSGNYWYYNDVLGEAYIDNYYSYYVVVHSSTLPAGNDVIATGTQSTAERPSALDYNALSSSYAFEYTSDGYLDNQVTLKRSNGSSAANGENAKLYWYASSDSGDNEAVKPIDGTILRYTGTGSDATATQGDLNTNDLYINLARPAANIFADAFEAGTGGSATIYIASKSPVSPIQWSNVGNFENTYLTVTYDGGSITNPSSFTITGRWGASVSSASYLANTSSGGPTTPTGVTAAYSIAVQHQISGVSGADLDNLRYNVYRNGSTTPLNGTTPIPYETNLSGGVYSDSGNWYYNDVVGAGGVGNDYSYEVEILSSKLPAGNNIVVAKSGTSSGTTTPSTADIWISSLTATKRSQGTRAGYYLNTGSDSIPVLNGARVYIQARYDGYYSPVSVAPRFLGTVQYTEDEITVGTNRIAIPANSYYVEFVEPDGSLETRPAYNADSNLSTWRYYAVTEDNSGEYSGSSFIFSIERTGSGASSWTGGTW